MGKRFLVEWQEDGTARVYGRLAAPQGTGTATGVPGEGNWIKQADLASIAYKVFDVTSSTPNDATFSGTLTVASVITDTPVTSSVNWVADSFGYNFSTDFAASFFPTGNHIFEIELTRTLSPAIGGQVGIDTLRGKARSIRGS